MTHRLVSRHGEWDGFSVSWLSRNKVPITRGAVNSIATIEESTISPRETVFK